MLQNQYIKSKASESEMMAALSQAKEQVCRYANTINVNEIIGKTQLHKVIVVYKGVEMVACEEIVD